MKTGVDPPINVNPYSFFAAISPNMAAFLSAKKSMTRRAKRSPRATITGQTANRRGIIFETVTKGLA